MDMMVQEEQHMQQEEQQVVSSHSHFDSLLFDIIDGSNSPLPE
jgi:hypothetical protein